MTQFSGFQLRERSGTHVLVTAAEAYPALERAFLSARREIWAGFRIFDLDTCLRSAEAREIGTTWFDLIVTVLRRRVALRVALTDFDPVARPVLHRKTWRSIRQFLAAAEVAGPSADLDAVAAMHAARTGILPRLAFWPVVQRRLGRSAAWLNDMRPEHRKVALSEMPGLARYLYGDADGRVHPRRAAVPALVPATHHQKLAVFDRRQLYIGGLDLNERRYDTQRHDRPGDQTWYDVQIMTDGPVVSEAQSHLERFAAVVARKTPPLPQRRLLRTLSRKRRFEAPFFGPDRATQEIALAHGALCHEAKRLIYLETQYFRDRGLARRLAACGATNPNLKLILMLPAAPDDIAFENSSSLDVRMGEFLQSRALKILRKGFGHRLFIGAGAQPRRPETSNRCSRRDRLRGAELVYIHAKVSIFDGRKAIVSSANLNGRSLRWDTEAGMLIDDPETVATLQHRVFHHWLPKSAGPEFFDVDSAVSAWQALAQRNAERPPEAREGFILPYDLSAAERDGLPVPVLPEEMV